MRSARTDNNQQDIINFFRDNGCVVAVTSSAHDGFTDIVIGYGGLTVLVEIKDGNKPSSQRKLTKKQKPFHENWIDTGAITVVESVEDASDLLCRLKEVTGLLDFNELVPYNKNSVAYGQLNLH